MTTPRSNKHATRPITASTMVGGALATNRQVLIWLVSVSMFLTCFLGWQNRLSYTGGKYTQGTVNKAFQVNAKRHNLTNTVKQISLIGERNSGTKWMWGHLHDCFNHAIPVEKKFSRYKHWFQPNDPFRYPHDTLVIAEFRNPYDWLIAMHHVPHHSPSHAGLDWKEFVTKTWTTPRIGLDLKLKGDETCQHHFAYKDLISCIHRPEPWKPVDNRTSLDKPFYEMKRDGSGEPYDNIMEMRSDKIRDTLEIKRFEGVADLWMVQYEYMLKTGTKELLDRITEWTGVKPKCKAYPPQERRQREMPEEFVQFVTDHLNWTTEAFIGYEPIRPISNNNKPYSPEEFEKFEASYEANDDDDDDATETTMGKNAERKTTSTNRDETTRNGKQEKNTRRKTTASNEKKTAKTTKKVELFATSTKTMEDPRTEKKTKPSSSTEKLSVKKTEKNLRKD